MVIAWRPAKAEEPSKRGEISWNVVNVGMLIAVDWKRAAFRNKTWKQLVGVSGWVSG